MVIMCGERIWWWKRNSQEKAVGQTVKVHWSVPKTLFVFVTKHINLAKVCDFRHKYVSLGGPLGTVDRDSQISVNKSQT